MQAVFAVGWKCKVKQWSEKQFSMRFPNSAKIDEWSHFRGIKMKSANASISVQHWDPAVGAKGALQKAWFRVRRIPFESRSEPVICYVGSLVGRTLDFDEASLMKEFVRIKIGCRDVTKVPAVVEGQIGDFFYDFLFERESPVEKPAPTQKVYVRVDTGNSKALLEENLAKKAKINQESSVQPSQNPSIIKSGDKTYKKTANSLQLMANQPKPDVSIVPSSSGAKVAIDVGGSESGKIEAIKNLEVSEEERRVWKIQLFKCKMIILTGLLKDLSKEDLIRGVESLLQTVASIDEMQQKRAGPAKRLRLTGPGDAEVEDQVPEASGRDEDEM